MTVPDTQDTPGLMMPPPIFLGVAVVLALILEWITGLSFLAAPAVTSPQTWLGMIVLVAGVWLSVAGAREFDRNGTNINPFQPALTLVTTGPYRFTRNPMYLGMTIILLGFSLMLSLEWGIILTPVLLLAFDRLVVAREEAYLTAKFGTPYRDFLARTRRWL
jgi:protein-S-isoprenylcysteine O-methyltransferase Ste14